MVNLLDGRLVLGDGFRFVMLVVDRLVSLGFGEVDSCSVRRVVEVDEKPIATG